MEEILHQLIPFMEEIRRSPADIVIKYLIICQVFACYIGSCIGISEPSTAGIVLSLQAAVNLLVAPGFQHADGQRLDVAWAGPIKRPTGMERTDDGRPVWFSGDFLGIWYILHQ